ncbi:hypothetical protein APT65_00110 [Trabzonvirus APT65]|uniref:Uncharacterized protein n=1 Tax=Aeromonas phage APT65 TaxID=2982914 RepID=A0A9E8GAS6_9CAUD|nr:hypothetical protein APT65_00110 [Aeromonas phage APT65]
MEYEVVNKGGLRASFDYICFGLLQMVDDWYRKGIEIFEGEDDTIGTDGPFETIRIYDKWGTHVYIKGFTPSDLKTLIYKYKSRYVEEEELDNFLRVLSHPVFKGVEFKKEHGYLKFYFDMESSRMDETMFKAFLIRNYFDSDYRRKSMQVLIDKGIPLETAFFIIQNYYISTGMGTYFNEDFEDGTILYDNYNPIGDLVFLILGDIPDYCDEYWSDSIAGYSDVGHQTHPRVVYQNDLEGEWEEETSFPSIHGRYDKCISTSSCYRKKEDYPEHLQSSFNDLIKGGDDEREMFINFAREIHERTEKERSDRAAAIQD